MTPNEDGEGTVLALGGESVQQCFVAVVVELLRSEFVAKLSKAVGQSGMAHGCDSGGGNDGHFPIVVARSDFGKGFSPLDGLQARTKPL